MVTIADIFDIIHRVGMLFGKYLKKYYKFGWWLLLLGVICLLAVDFAETKIPGYIEKIIDALTEAANDPLLTINDVMPSDVLWIQNLIPIIAWAAVILVGRILYRIFIFYFARRTEKGLRGDMFEKSTRLSLGYYHDNKVGNIMALYSDDIEEVGEFFGWGSVMLVDAVFLSVLVIYRMVRLNWALSLVAALPIVLIVIWGAIVEKYMGKKWKERQKAFDELYSFSQENFSGIRLIKSFVKETQEILAFKKVALKNKNVNYSFAKFEIVSGVVIEIIIALIVALMMGVGGYIVYRTLAFNQGMGEALYIFDKAIDLTPGQLVNFISLFDILIWPMIAMGQIITMHSRAKQSLIRISNFLDTPEDIKNPENPKIIENPHGKITFNDFSFQYPDGDHQVLKHLSFEIKPGERIGVVGRIGSGKSSLAKVLLRQYNYNEGTLFIDGVDSMKADLKSLRDCIAYAPQDNFLFSDTIEENIAFSDSSVNESKVNDAAIDAAVDGDVALFPSGYKTVLGEKGMSLSGGQRQRLSLARAYYKNAPIMIMDDTVSAVDLDTETKIIGKVFEVREGKTTIVIASRLSTVKNFDKILVLKKGELEAFGAHEELMETSETYRSMVSLQALEDEVNS